MPIVGGLVCPILNTVTGGSNAPTGGSPAPLLASGIPSAIALGAAAVAWRRRAPDEDESEATGEAVNTEI